MLRTSLDDTIVAVSTPIGEGGIGIVRMSGPKALEIADRIFLSKDGRMPSAFNTYTVHYGHVINRKQKTENGERRTENGEQKHIDEVLLTVMKSPKSYTREDIVEINCHGGPAVLKEILGLVAASGARIAEPGEFTKRAFLNGRIDLVKAEAVLDIIKAKTDSSLRLAMSQLEGALSKEVNVILERLSGILSRVEAAIDFPDEEIEIMKEEDLHNALKGVKEGLERLLATADQGIVAREGILAIICGKPNVGKSSLMNLLLKRDRVIVTPIPGTTRDAVEETINLRGFPMRLVDTAGIHQTLDPLGLKGIERSRRYLQEADMALFVLDGSSPVDAEDRVIAGMVKDKKVLVIINKADLPQKVGERDVKDILESEFIVNISALRQDVEPLEDAMLKLAGFGGVFQQEGAIVSNARHKALLEHSLERLQGGIKSVEDDFSAEFIAQDLKEAIYQLGLIVGKSVSCDILDRIFSEFCVGK